MTSPAVAAAPVAPAARKFEPGTTGWTVADLSDPDIGWRWSEGRYELVDGVLTKMPPQGFQGIDPLSRLRRLLERHLDATDQGGYFHNEVDLVLKASRIPRPDMVFLTPEQYESQRAAEQERGLTEEDYCPLFVVPLLVVESVSVGHEDHDRLTKRVWYAEAGVPHYWLLDRAGSLLECLALPRRKARGGAPRDYRREALGRGDQTVRSRLFGGVEVPLKKLWATR